MKEIFDRSTQRVPIYAWLDDLEPGALDQARNLAQLPFAWQHVALLPRELHGFRLQRPADLRERLGLDGRAVTVVHVTRKILFTVGGE